MEPFKSSPVSARAAGMDYKEIKSHSSLLSNERLAILFYMLDLSSINLNTYYNEKHLVNTKAILYQLYKNVRTIIRNNAQVRSMLSLETKTEGVYTIDVAFNFVNQMLTYCMFHGFTYKRCYAISEQLNFIEISLRDVLQFFNYFFRPEYKQKPDVMIATERYKQMADKITVDKLREIVGKGNKIDFEHLGVGFTEEGDKIEYTEEDDPEDLIEKNDESTVN